MKYEIKEVMSGGYYSRGAYYCSIKAAQKAIGVDKPNNTDCIIHMAGNGSAYHRAAIFHITRIHNLKAKLI
jgi:hypothetical protein